MADGLLVERLRQYLRELKPEARALLMAELERGLLRGEEPPGAELVLQELRRNARDRRAARRVPAIRRVCSSSRSSRSWSTTSPPTAIPAASRASRSSRSGTGSAAICCRAKPRPMTDQVARAFEAKTPQKAEQLARAFQDRVVHAHAGGARSRAEPTTRRAAGWRPRSARRARSTTCTRSSTLLQARDALADLRFAVARPHQESCRRQLRRRQGAAGFAALPAAPPLFLYALVMVMSRLAAPWQLIRLATQAAASDATARIAETPYAIAVNIVLAEIDAWSAN